MPVAKKYWIVKQEPGTYSWADLVKEGGTPWTGVRNFAARKNLRAMRKGDLTFFYHSGEEKQIVGIARVEREDYPDPTAEEGDWSAVDISPVKPLTKVVALETLKGDPALKTMPMIKQSRLSVSSLDECQAQRILALGKTKV
jgi:predicted RNA-binding protein with PUA-like domain